MREETSLALVPTEAYTIDFYGDAITAVLVEVDGQAEVYVPLSPLCRYLRLDWSSQRKRVLRDPVLRDASKLVRVLPKNQGGDPIVLALPLEYLPGWLFGISVRRVHPCLQESLYRYRRECFRVLAAHFPQSLLLATLTKNDLPERIAVPGTLYIVRGYDCYKIGIAKDVTKRLRTLNTALPFRLELIHAIDTDDAPLLERRLHRVYRAAGKHVNGEWFTLGAADVEALKAVPSPLSSGSFDEAIHILTNASHAKE